MSGPQPSMAPGRAPVIADVRARVMAAVEGEPVVTRAIGARRRVVLAIVAGVIFAAASFGAVRPGLGGRPPGYVGSLTLAWLLIGVAATWAGVTRGRSMLGRPVAWRVAVAVATPVALLAASLACGMVWPSAPGDDPGIGPHLVCLFTTIGLALGPFALFFALRGANDPVRPHLTGAAIAAAAGAWGALGIELHCAITVPCHVLVGHVLPVALLGVAGMTAGWFVALRPENR